MRADAALAALDAAIAEAPASERPGLVVALAARLASLGAALAQAPTSSPLPDENLSVEEGARRLGLSKQYVYRHAAELPTVRVGRRLLLSARGVERFIRDRSRAA